MGSASLRPAGVLSRSKTMHFAHATAHSARGMPSRGLASPRQQALPAGSPGPIRSSRSAIRHASSICSALHSLVPQ